MKPRRMCLLLAASLWLTPGNGAAQDLDALRVVIHPDNTITALSKDDLAAIYLKRTTRWPDGTTARPVDITRSVPVREHFSRAVLGRSTGAMVAYWQQQIFSGRGVPPTELASEAAVIRFVRDNPGAVGYVSPDADVRGVRVVEVRP